VRKQRSNACVDVDGRSPVAVSRLYTHTPEEILAVGDRVVLRTTNRATHRGDFRASLRRGDA